MIFHGHFLRFSRIGHHGHRENCGGCLVNLLALLEGARVLQSTVVQVVVVEAAVLHRSNLPVEFWEHACWQVSEKQPYL